MSHGTCFAMEYMQQAIRAAGEISYGVTVHFNGNFKGKKPNEKN